MPKAPVADDTNTRLMEHSIGNKADAAAQAVGATTSMIAYLKGLLNALLGTAGITTFPAAAKAANAVSLAEVLRYIQEKKLDVVETAAGEADIDISEAVYTGYITLLTIAPAAGEALLDCWLHLDWNKTTTGAHAIGTAADTLDAIVMMKVDDTNLRHAQAFTQVTISDTPSDEASGQRVHIGPIGPTETCVVKVKVSAERDDVEIPYRIMYRGAAPTITPVAAAA